MEDVVAAPGPGTGQQPKPKRRKSYIATPAEMGILETRQNLFVTPGALLGQAVPRTTTQESLLGQEDSAVLSAQQTVFNLANVVIGVGVLSVPFALKQSGYFALVLFLVVLWITGKTGKWIGQSLDLAASSKLAAEFPPAARDFGFLAEVAFGPRANTFISGVTVAEVWMALVAFMAMNTQNTSIILPEVSTAVTVFVSGALAAVFCFIPSNAFAYLSFVATLAMLVAAVALVNCTFMMSQWADPYKHLGSAALIQPGNIPRSVGIIVFCFAGHPCFPSVKTAMLQPSKWDTCVDLSFLVALIYYGAFGCLGYLVFGTQVNQTVTQNLVGIRGVEFCRNLAALCFVVKIQLTMPLLLNAVMVALWRPEAGAQWPPRRVLILFLAAGATSLAGYLAAQAVAVIASLAGSLLIMVTSVIFPTMVHLTLAQRGGGAGPKKRLSKLSLEYIQHIVVLVFGVVMAVLGTSLAISDFLAAAGPLGDGS